MWRIQNYFKIAAVAILVCLINSSQAQTIDEAKTLYNEGGNAMQAGDLELAIEKFVECIDICQVLYDEEEDVEAEDLMYSVQQTVPKIYYQLSTEKLQAGEMESGIKFATSAKETAEEYGEDEVAQKATKLLTQVYYKIGVSKYKAKSYDEAIAELDKAIAIDENYANAYYIKAVIYKTQGNDDLLAETSLKGIAASEAINSSKSKEKISGLASSYFLKKGNEAKESSKYDEAITMLNKSIEFNAEDPTSYFLLTSIYNSQENWAKAIETANEGIKYESATEAARFYFELGNAYFGSGDKAAACDAFTKAAVGDYIEHANYQMEHVVKCNE